MAIQLTVKAESRFAKAFTAYNDQVKHGYNPNYVNPQTRRINLQVSNLPTNMKSWEWRVTRRGDNQVFSKSGKVLFTVSTVLRSEGFNLDSEGVYDCQYIATLQGGKEEKSPVKSIHLRDLLVVVIGDSAASGEGNPDEPGKLNISDGTLGGAIADIFSKFAVEYLTSLIIGKTFDPPNMDQPPRWLEKNAHRSLRAGHVQAAGRLENLKAGTVVTALTFARSGSRIINGLIRSRKDERRGDNEASWINTRGKTGQIDELRSIVGKRKIDALIISIGGNDLGFAAGVKEMIQGDSDWWGPIYVRNNDDNAARKAIRQKVDDLLGKDGKSGQITKIGGEFDQLFTALKTLNIGKVFITGYPTGFFDIMDSNKNIRVAPGCEVLESKVDQGLDLADTQLFKEVAQRLNNALRSVIAPRYSWEYIDVVEDFAGHGYCSKASRFFIHAEESLKIQGDGEGMLHPNAQGHKIYADQIHKALNEVLILKMASNPVEGVVADSDKPSDNSGDGKIDLGDIVKPVVSPIQKP